MATDANRTTAQLVAAALPHMINSAHNVLVMREHALRLDRHRLASEVVRTALQYLVQMLEDRDALIALTLAECSIETHDEDGTEIPIPTRVRMMAMRALHPGPPVPPVADGPIKLYDEYDTRDEAKPHPWQASNVDYTPACAICGSHPSAPHHTEEPSK